MKIFAPHLLLTIIATAASAADLALTLMPPNAPVAPGHEVVIDLVALNPASASVPFDVGFLFLGRLTTDNGTWPVELRASAAAPASVASGSFVVRPYTLVVPAEAAGRAVLEVSQNGLTPLRTVFDVGRNPTPANDAPITPLSRLASSARAVDSVVNRTFAGRITPNDPIYFVYGGGDDASAKFQFSFNYRLASFDWGEIGHQKTSTVQLGYTQRSLWDIDAQSSPFYDTSYMPEVSLDTLAALPAGASGPFTWVGLRTGYLHESNGRDGDDSRSLNTVYVRPMFAIGPLESWHLVAFPEVFAYVAGVDDNERIKDYRGYGRLRMVFGRNNGPSLLLAAWTGKDFDHLTYQLDLAYPIRTHFLNIESFLLLQYFRGYGESLRSYDKKSDALRAGIELLR